MYLYSDCENSNSVSHVGGISGQLISIHNELGWKTLENIYSQTSSKTSWRYLTEMDMIGFFFICHIL